MRSTERLLGDLVARMEPVRQIPPLRAVAAAALALGALASAGVLGLRGIHTAGAALDPPMVLVALGLAMVGVGGIAASLGAAVPGRERVARIGLAALIGGLALAAGAAGWGHGSGASAAWEEIGLTCLRIATLAGLLPSVALLTFLVLAFPHWPVAALAAAAVGAVGMGALSVHASCPVTGWTHVLLQHALAPLIGGPVLAIVLYPILRWLRR